MKALVLAAGRGSRLGSAAGGMPKPLVQVGETTPLQHVLAWVAGERPERIWVNVHDGGELVQARIGTEAHGVPVSYSHEPELLGTAGAWKKLEAEWTTVSMVIYGDNLMRFDLAALRATHARSGVLATVAVFDPQVHPNTGPGGGRVTLDGGRVTRFEEGGASGLINAGAYILEPALRERVPHGFADFGHDVLPGLAATGQLAAHIVEPAAYCLGVDTPERLESARRMIASREVSA